MDNKTAKEILGAYRPNGSDALDETFKDALQHAERDPETKAWFEAQRDFDKAATSAMADMDVPQEGKERLLSMIEMGTTGPKTESPKTGVPSWIAWGGLAAAIALGIFIPPLLDQAPPPGDTPYIASKANFSLAELARHAMPLQHHDGSPQALEDWLAANNAPVPEDIPQAIRGSDAKGCKVFHTEEGGKISLLCFKLEGKVLHMFVFDDKARPLLDTPQRQWWREGEWNMMTMEHGNQLIAIATHADKADLDALI